MTKHGTRASHSKSGLDEVEEGPAFDVHETVEILECLGCEHLVVRRTYTHEAFDEANIEFYPPPISRPMPRWSRIIGNGVPSRIRDVMKEVYKALQANSHVLATMGARTILDLVLVEKVGDIGSFERKLKALEEGGFVGKKNREFLAAALDAGSAVAHRVRADENRPCGRFRPLTADPVRRIRGKSSHQEISHVDDRTDRAWRSREVSASFGVDERKATRRLEDRANLRGQEAVTRSYFPGLAARSGATNCAPRSLHRGVRRLANAYRCSV